jgi:hypothetical protein
MRPAASAVLDRRGADGVGCRRARALHAGSPAADRVAEQRQGARPDRATDVALTCARDCAHDVEHLGVVTRRPSTKRRIDPAALHLGRDLRPGAVDDDDVVALLPQRERLGRSRQLRPRPAELDHDAAHVVYSALIRT